MTSARDRQCKACGYDIGSRRTKRCPECGVGVGLLPRPRFVNRNRYVLVVIVVFAIGHLIQIAQVMPLETLGRRFSIGWPFAFWIGDGDPRRLELWEYYFKIDGFLGSLRVFLVSVGGALICDLWRRRADLPVKS